MDMLKECAVISQKKVCIQKQRIKQSWHVVEKRTHNKRKTWRVTKKKTWWRKEKQQKINRARSNIMPVYIIMLTWLTEH